MSVTWIKAEDDVLEMARSLIDMYHPWLKEARILILMRDSAPIQNGRSVLGKASKVTAKQNAMIDAKQPYHFLIWLAEDFWSLHLDHRQKRALLDHELCHCVMGENDWAIRGHDIEEFNIILERHGLWNDTVRETAQTISQMKLINLEANGTVATLDDRSMDRLVAKVARKGNQ